MYCFIYLFILHLLLTKYKYIVPRLLVDNTVNLAILFKILVTWSLMFLSVIVYLNR